MDFNVSHQAGIVSLIAVVGIPGDVGEKVEVGTDVVCWNERLVQDYASIEKEGFFNWVDIHGDVFSESEISYMKLGPVDIDLPPEETAGGEINGGFAVDKVSRCQWRNETLQIPFEKGDDDDDGVIEVSSNEVVDKKLRRFYACWCLREAYIKMTGEALLAPWLKDLEIMDVGSPAASHIAGDGNGLEIGDVGRDFRIRFKSRPVTNVLLELTALGKNYMVGGAIRPKEKVEKLGLRMGEWEHLDLERDVLAFAESSP